MIRFSFIFLALVCVFGGAAIAKSFDNLEEDFIRIPLVTVHTRTRRDAEKSIKFWNDRNIHYAINMTVGTPPQSFSMNFDTGSSDMWVPSKDGDCPVLCKSINKFDSSKSTTYVTDNKQFSIGYETGGVKGIIAKDTVTIAGLTITDQVIGVGTNEDVDSYNYPFDGTIGFSYSGDISMTDPGNTVLENLQKQNKLKKRFACVKLHNDNESGGELMLGGCDVDAEYWGDVSGPGYWQIALNKMEAIGPNGTSRASLCDAGSAVTDCQAVLDTGAGGMGGPTKIIDPIATKLGGVYDESLNDYVVDCDDVTLGTLEYTFGEYKVSLAPEDYLGLTPNGYKCVLNLARLDNLPNLLLGDPFLRKVTLLLDQENKRAGFAKSETKTPDKRPRHN